MTLPVRPPCFGGGQQAGQQIGCLADRVLGASRVYWASSTRASVMCSNSRR